MYLGKALIRALLSASAERTRMSSSLYHSNNGPVIRASVMSIEACCALKVRPM